MTFLWHRSKGTEAKARPATSTEHYVLNCVECGFAHPIPRATTLPSVAFSVDVNGVAVACVYGGGAFTVKLDVKGFFTITTVPESGQVLHASIADNMKPLHEHMTSHYDPLFLVIEQSASHTTHRYSKQPQGHTFVKFSKEHGTDVVGKIDVSKAEIPGISW